MEQGHWIAVIAIVAVLTVGTATWMSHLSFAVGKMVSELHAINEKLGGQLDWLKSLDSKVDDHEKRLMHLEAKDR